MVSSLIAKYLDLVISKATKELLRNIKTTRRERWATAMTEVNKKVDGLARKLAKCRQHIACRRRKALAKTVRDSFSHGSHNHWVGRCTRPWSGS